MAGTGGQATWPHIDADHARSGTLLLGASGWLGSQVKQALAQRKHLVVIADRSLSHRLTSSGSGRDLVEVVGGHRIASVINCIRPAGNPQSARSYVLASSRLAEICASSGIRLLHVGSAAEYGVPLCEKIAEDHPCRPTSEYATAKAAASSAVIAHGGVVLRPFNILGPRQPLHTVVGEWVGQLRCPPRADGTISLHVQDPDTVRDFVSLDFVANVIASLVQPSHAVSVVNVCSGRATSFGKMAEALVRHVQQRGARVEVTFGKVSGSLRGPQSSCIPRVVGDPRLVESLGHRSQASVGQLAAEALANSHSRTSF